LLSEYYENLALSSAKIGKTDEAIDDYKQAIDLYPAGAGNYYLHMGILLYNGNVKSDPAVTKQAADAFDKAIAADPTIADAYYFKGNTLMGLVKMDSNNKIIAAPGTVEAFQKYLELKPDGPYAADAKSMLAALGSTVETNYGSKKKK
jgi:tetratricopeptide (TPR) repeat protein